MSPPLLSAWPASFTPTGFLTTFVSDLVSCDLLNRQERGFLARHGQAALKGERDVTHDVVVRDYWYLMSCHFLRQIPEEIDARVYDADRLHDEFDRNEMKGGYPLTSGAIPSEDTVIEVRCSSKSFDEASKSLPRSVNFEIGLRQIEQGLRSRLKLVAFGGLDADGVMPQKPDRRMAFRLASPTILAREFRAEQGRGGLSVAFMNQLSTYREYEFLLGRRRWPVVCPMTSQDVDDEGPQHPVYALYHDFSHLGVRAARPPVLQEVSQRMLRAGLEVFPEVDDAKTYPRDAPVSMMRRFFGDLIELDRIYFEEQLAERLAAIGREWKLHPIPSAERNRYRRFLNQVHRAALSFESGAKSERVQSVVDEVRRQLEGAS